MLRAKVQSKIDVAKVLGGVITLTLGWVLTGSDIDKGDLRVQVAVVTLLVSLALYVAALEAYDTLLMPDEFWAGPRRTERDVAKTIHDKMVCVWAGMFVPATLALLTGLLLFVWAAFDSAWVMVGGLAWSLGAYAAVTVAFGPGLLEDGAVLHCRTRRAR